MAEAHTPAATLAKRRPVFRASRTASALSNDEARRETDIARLAFQHLGAEAARQFLNTYDERLNGRPLAIATSSAEGALIIEQVITARAARLHENRVDALESGTSVAAAQAGDDATIRD